MKIKMKKYYTNKFFKLCNVLVRMYGEERQMLRKFRANEKNVFYILCVRQLLSQKLF